ncbi:superoxide dismutase family protein [Halobacillus yeomjeoni]|uniref:Superoxide dismutase [Cu-Zn] n=1 Tax=Halobacillus yeomjeoni TaxID=311194 RepID=A0A931MWH1_9BACI|nr:superoxide dismutase family protein [Halobacillus yeomjeoni]MBH0231301.1 superoxide dismutase family protein [Halobacillus yeomjeoni]
MKRWVFLFAIATLALVLSACGSSSETDSSSTQNETESTTGETNSENSENEESGSDESEEMSEELQVTLKNADGNEVATAILKEDDNGVEIDLNGTDLPEGTHGFHIHETGSCEAPDFKSAGGHFNPTNASHGTETEDGPHAGDLPNIEVSSDGMVQTTVNADMVTLKPEQDNSLLKEEGTALVIHAGADDKKSQPSGDAGERIACGVIGE